MKTVLIGVDGSSESVRAAVLGEAIARRSGATCRIVHAAAEYWTGAAVPELALDLQALADAAGDQARALMRCSLEGHVSPSLIDGMSVQLGRGPAVLAAAAAAEAADVVVLGGKHRGALARLGGSTVTNLVRLGGVPILAADGMTSDVRRILVAADLSWAAGPAIAVARRWATLMGAQLRVLHVVEPMHGPAGTRLPMSDQEIFSVLEHTVRRQLGALAGPDADIVTRRGRSAAAITLEARRWGADLIVLGSHGKGWVDRLLIGSTSERLLQVLPAPILVVPVGTPDLQARPADAAVAQARSRG